MPATLSQCFPDLLSTQWPTTSHPVLCECRQLYALVSICCCIPSTHLLVLHDGTCNTTITSMPKGPTYLELQITEQTTSEIFCSFLSRTEAATAGGGDPAEPHQRPVNIVCVTGIATASSSVQSALMDVLQFGLVHVGGEARCVPSIRIIAYCDAHAYATAVPEWLRAGFTLSTYMSSLTMESAAVIQSSENHKSNVVNRRNMLEVMLSDDGYELADTVTLSCEVSRYLRHILIVLRSATLHHSVPGTCLPQRVPLLLRVLKVAALLFAQPVIPRGRKSHLSARNTMLMRGQRQLLQEQCSRDAPPITSFAHVVASPAHVTALLCPMVAHLFTAFWDMTLFRFGPDVHPNTSGGHFFAGRMGGRGGRSLHGDAANTDGAEDESPRQGVEVPQSIFDSLDSAALRWISQEMSEGESFFKAEGREVGGSDKEVGRPAHEMTEGVLSYTDCRELIRIVVTKHSAPPNG